MCNLYTTKFSRDEVRALFRHYELHDQRWSDVFEQEMAGLNSDGRIFPKYAAPTVILENGKQTLDHPKWGMPGPVMLGERATRPKFIKNVRNTASRHWTPWLAGSEVVVGKDGNRGGRCLVPAAAFSEPDENTSNPRVFRWFKRNDGLPFFFAGVWRKWGEGGGLVRHRWDGSVLPCPPSSDRLSFGTFTPTKVAKRIIATSSSAPYGAAPTRAPPSSRQ